MFKQNREIKILRDKKDKEIRRNLKLKLDKININYLDYKPITISSYHRNYSVVYKFIGLQTGINTKGMNLHLSNKKQDLLQGKYNKPYKYDLYFGNLTNKKNKLYKERGHNKGNTQRNKGAKKFMVHILLDRIVKVTNLN